MKQLNVRDETHYLCKTLCAKTGKSMIVVVQEALELYREGCRELSSTESLVSKLLGKVGSTIEASFINTATIAIPGVVKRAIEEIYAERAAEDERLKQLMQEAADEEGDDLTVVDHDEFYGTDDEEA